MHPQDGAWEQLLGVIEHQREVGRKLPYPHFDWQEGWGRNFKATGDSWESIKQKSGNTWKFHGGHSDQGLWFYYTKYVRKDVTFIIGDKLQTWGRNPNSTDDSEPYLVREVFKELEKYTPEPLVWQNNCKKGSRHFRCLPPYSDIGHFMGKTKPWQKGSKRTGDQHSIRKLWFQELRVINKELNIGLDRKINDDRGFLETPPLGFLPAWWDNAHAILEYNASSTKNKI